jgi:hypothetical protein
MLVSSADFLGLNHYSTHSSEWPQWDRNRLVRSGGLCGLLGGALVPVDPSSSEGYW